LTFLAPACRRGQRLVDDLEGEGADQPGLLHHGDEGVGGEHASRRVLPASEGFEHVHLTAGGVDLRLEEQRELVIGQCVAQLGHQGELGHARLVPTDVVAGNRLTQLPTLAARLLGTGEQGVGVGAVLGPAGHPGPRLEQDAQAVDLDLLRQPAQQMVGDARRRTDVGQPRGDHHEGVTHQPPDDVALPGRGDQALGEFDEQPVAGRGTQGVVDLLEVVDVDQHDGDRGMRRIGRGDRAGQAVVQQPPVGQAGQRVVLRRPCRGRSGAHRLGVQSGVVHAQPDGLAERVEHHPFALSQRVGTGEGES
jgi:hypothetical protein